MVAVTTQAIENAKRARERYYQENKEKVAAMRREYYLKNRELFLARNKAHYEDNKEWYLRRSRGYTSLIKQHTPAWADKEAITALYNSRPEGYHVDHIIPLRGTNVSGLHVENNLRVIPALENLQKGNSYE